MVMTEWMRSVQEALKTIPPNTPNRLKAAMVKAKLTYKKKGSSSAPAAPAAAVSHGMKRTHRHRRSGKGKGRKGSRRHSKRRGSSRKHKGGAMSTLRPASLSPEQH